MVEYKAENFGVVGSNPIKSILITGFPMQQLVLSYVGFNKVTKFNRVNKFSLNVYMNNREIKFISILSRLSSFFKLTVLVDIILYEVNNKNYVDFKFKSKNYKNRTASLVIFNQLSSHAKFMYFSLIKKSTTSLDSLFLNAYWIEREFSELFGIILKAKGDARNLLLAYNDTTSPFRKAFSPAGLFELFFSLILDFIVRHKTLVS